MSVTSHKQLTTILGVGLTVGLGVIIAARLIKNKKCCKEKPAKEEPIKEEAIKEVPKKESNNKEPTYIASLEMGGTGCKVAVILRTWNKTTGKYEYEILSRDETESTIPQMTVDRLYNYIHQDFTEVGIASFGPVCLNKADPAFGSITSTPKLQWQNFGVLNYVRDRFKCDNVSIDTDVNAAALAEYKLGNHNAKSLIYVTVGTGVGVGVVIDGKPVHGLTHPEGGHIFVRLLEADKDFEGVCPFHKNCLEGLVTNVSVAKRLDKKVEDLPNVEKDHEVWERVAYYLAQLCLNLTLIASPEVILLGGGVMNQPTLLGNIQTKFTELLNSYVVHPRIIDVTNYIKRPTLGDNVGLLGAAVLREPEN